MAVMKGLVTACTAITGASDDASKQLAQNNYFYIVAAESGQNVTVMAGKQEFQVEQAVTITVEVAKPDAPAPPAEPQP